jgi:NAD(P)-dependent dehydrogenase (short-subunit alcohol dehydrogenase family)
MGNPLRAEQKQSLPGVESAMQPRPLDENPRYVAAKKLEHKVAIITGGDSGIGKAVAIAFAKEGADVVISYLAEDEDAEATQERITQLGRQCVLVKGDISDSKQCQRIVDEAVNTFGKVDILVNHAGEQYQHNDFEEIPDDEIERIFKVNVFSTFYLTKAALKHMPKGGAIINTVSVVAYEGNPLLIDYTATKAALVGFTRALSQSLVKKGIRVNGVAPGPIWTPLIPASFDKEKVAQFGSQAPMGRAGQPWELAPAYVYLAANCDSSYVTGQVLHVNGGKVVNG